MTFKESVEICLLKKYFFNFRGRAPRSEFWWFMLFIFLVNAAASLLFSLMPVKIGASLSLALSLMIFPANLGVTVRRLHDRGMRGWWLLLPILSLVAWGMTSGNPGGNTAGSLLSLCMCLCYLAILCMPGQPGANRYGPNPLESQKM